MTQKLEFEMTTIAKGFLVIMGLLGVTAFVPDSKGDVKEQLNMHVMRDSIETKYMNDNINKMLISLDKLNEKTDTLMMRSITRRSR